MVASQRIAPPNSIVLVTDGASLDRSSKCWGCRVTRVRSLHKFLLQALAFTVLTTEVGAQPSQSLMDTQLTGLKTVGPSIIVNDENGPVVASEPPLIAASKRILESGNVRIEDGPSSILRIDVRQSPVEFDN